MEGSRSNLLHSGSHSLRATGEGHIANWRGTSSVIITLVEKLEDIRGEEEIAEDDAPAE